MPYTYIIIEKIIVQQIFIATTTRKSNSRQKLKSQKSMEISQEKMIARHVSITSNNAISRLIIIFHDYDTPQSANGSKEVKQKRKVISMYICDVKWL